MIGHFKTNNFFSNQIIFSPNQDKYSTVSQLLGVVSHPSVQNTVCETEDLYLLKQTLLGTSGEREQYVTAFHIKISKIIAMLRCISISWGFFI